MKILKKFYFLIIFFLLPFSANSTGLPVMDVGAIAELFQETSMLKSELEKLKSGQYEWSNAQGLINNLGAAVNQTNSLAYSSSNVNQEFQQAYPGYVPPQNYSQQYQSNANMTLNMLNGVLQSMGSNAQDFQNENSRLKFLQQQSQSASGQMQAIQAATQIASEMVTQQQLLRQTMIAQTNAQAAYYATQVQNDASARAELQQVIQTGSTNVPAYGSSGHQLTTPTF